MKVLHLGKFYPPARGGMESILALICRETGMRVHNRVLVANHAPGHVEENDGATAVVRVRSWMKVGAVALCPSLPFYLARERADVIVLHEPNPMALLAYFLVRPAGRLVLWFHSDVIRPGWRYRLFYEPFLNFALSSASRIAVSSARLAQTAPALAAWQSKCVVVPFGVPMPREIAGATARAQQIRAEIGKPFVLFVGRLVPYKGVDVLLDALRESRAAAVIVGDGPQREALMRQAAALGLSDRVRFAGAVTDAELAALYSACEAFVLPSVTRQEAFGVVQIEAMARGCPVICSDVGTGVAWVNVHGQTGLVVPPNDAVALRRAIERLLEHPDERRRMSAAAQERARTVFAVDRMARAICSLYDEVAGSHVRQTVA